MVVWWWDRKKEYLEYSWIRPSGILTFRAKEICCLYTLLNLDRIKTTKSNHFIKVLGEKSCNNE